MTPAVPRRLLFATVASWLALAGIFAFMLQRSQRGLHAEIRRTVIGRDAAVLHPIARSQIAAHAARAGGTARTDPLLAAVLDGAQVEGVMAVSVFNDRGELVRALPASLLFAELPADDYVALLRGEALSRFHPEFPLDRWFAGVAPRATAPVLEVLLPLARSGDAPRLGFAHYLIDGRALGENLAAIETRVRRQTAQTLAVGVALIGLVLAGLAFGLARAQRILAERNERLARANFDLTLAAKASALGQLTSHLIHGLQGSVAGLRTAVTTEGATTADWESAVFHAERLQALVSEVVALLGDARAGVASDIEAGELAELIRQRAVALANPRGVQIDIVNRLRRPLDSHRGSILCLIASNLVQNAVRASAAGQRVALELRESASHVELHVSDEAGGIPPEILPRLFTPGATGAGGTGLGLAISRLLARQMDGDLELVLTGPGGTTFRTRVALEHRPASSPEAKRV